MNPSSGTTIWNIIMWWVGLAGAANAPSAAERGYSLQYQSAAGCPDASVLARAIETRVPGAQQHPAERAAELNGGVCS